MNKLAMVVLLCMAPSVLSAQTVTAKIVGVITDPSGAAVVGARVSAKHLETNQVRSVETAGDGSFELPFMQIGRYTMEVGAAGFQTASVKEFLLNVGQTSRIDVSLTLGSVSESVSVEASAVALQSETVTLGSVIDRQKVAELPLNGRTFIQLALLAPGVNPGTPGSLSVRGAGGSLGQSAGMSVNGVRDNMNRYYYDGVEAMSMGSYSFTFALSVDAIQEFKVETNAYSAETGAAAGGHVNLTTKSGSNEWHGMAWEFNRNDKLTALEPFQAYSTTAKPPRLNRNQFGANLGGPVVKDKTFFFFNWESGRLITGTSGARRFVPPTAYRSGDFSASALRIFDPSTGQPFPNNIIPASRINRITGGYLQYVPSPNTNETAVNYTSPAYSAATRQNQYTVRMDHRFGDRNSLYGTYIFNQQRALGVPAMQSWDWSGSVNRGQHATLTDTHVFSATVVNELRLGWHRRRPHGFNGTTDNPELDISNKLGVPGVSKDPRNFGPPTFGGAGYDLTSVSYIGPADQHNQIWQAGDTLVFRRGGHSMKLGGMYYRRNFSFDEAFNPRGVFSFDGRTTSGGVTPGREHSFASYLLGLATNASISPDPFSNRMNQNWQSYFFQDDWKVLPTLTINAGIRYEYFSQPVERGKAVNFALEGGAVPGFVLSNVLYSGFPDIPDTPGYPRALMFPDKNNFAPRLGLAWKPARWGETVVRAGYGVYYSQEVTNSYTSFAFNPPIVRNITFDSTFNNPIRIENAFGGTGTVVTGQFGANGIDPGARDAYVQQWNMTVQKKLPAGIYFDIGYVGTKGTRMPLAIDGNRPINVVNPAIPGTPSVAARRPFAGWGYVRMVKSSGNTSYKGLQMRAERRLSRGLSFITSYTYSKSMSDMDQSTVGGGFWSPSLQDQFNQKGEKSFAAFDLRHRMSAAVIWDVPLFAKSSSSMLRTMLGGWQLGTIMTLQTGFAATVAGVGDTTGTGVSSRPDMSGSPDLGRGERSRDRWFDTSVFSMTPMGRFGTAPRTQIHFPGLTNFDVSATKNFRFLERHNLQLRAEMFNFFNHVNLGAPGLSLTAPNTFGKITSSSQGPGVDNGQRIVQLALKYSF